MAMLERSVVWRYSPGTLMPVMSVESRMGYFWKLIALNLDPVATLDRLGTLKPSLPRSAGIRPKRAATTRRTGSASRRAEDLLRKELLSHVRDQLLLAAGSVSKVIGIGATTGRRDG